MYIPRPPTIEIAKSQRRLTRNMENDTPDTQQTQLDSVQITSENEVVLSSESPSATPENKSVRIITRITKEQREILEKYYNQGMKSKSKESRLLQHGAAEECGLPLHIILVGIFIYNSMYIYKL